MDKHLLNLIGQRLPMQPDVHPSADELRDGTMRRGQRQHQNDEAKLRIYLRAIYTALGNLDGDLLQSDLEEHRKTVKLFRASDGQMTAEDAHTAWLGRKESAGWVFGRKYDPVAKTHPQLKPFRDLPPFEKRAEEAGIDALRLGLTRLHFWRGGSGGTKPMSWVATAARLFNQKPIALVVDGGCGFEIRTLMSPDDAKAALERGTNERWQMAVLS